MHTVIGRVPNLVAAVAFSVVGIAWVIGVLVFLVGIALTAVHIVIG
jgi:uncharacterized membrane protein (DUF485 family)